MLAVIAAVVAWQAWPGGTSESTAASVEACISQAWGQFPLSFEANQGQAASQVEFLSRGQGYTLFLKPTEAVLSLTRPADVQQNPDLVKTIDGSLESPEPKAEPPTVLRMQLVEANTSAKVTGLDQLPGKTNYLIGNGPAQWRTNIANFARVQYQDVYPGIDLVYYDLVAWIIPKDALSSCFSTLGIT